MRPAADRVNADGRALTDASDTHLVDAAIDGDDTAFYSLMVRYAPLVAGYFLGNARSTAESVDLVQEVFLRAHASLSRMRGYSPLGPLLAGLAQCVWRDVLRERRREPRYTPPPKSPPAEIDAFLQDAVGDTGTRLQALPLAGYGDVVQEQIGALPDPLRILVYLRLVHGLDTETIADLTGAPEPRIRVQLGRALRELRERLARARRRIRSTAGGEQAVAV